MHYLNLGTVKRNFSAKLSVGAIVACNKAFETGAQTDKIIVRKIVIKFVVAACLRLGGFGGAKADVAVSKAHVINIFLTVHSGITAKSVHPLSVGKAAVQEAANRQAAKHKPLYFNFSITILL